MNKNYFDIHCEQDKVKAKEFIDKIDINNNIRLFIDTIDKIKTLQQLKYFHKIVKEFTEFMINNDYNDNNENDWKTTIKKRAHFYKSNTGITFLEKDLKKRMYNLLLTGEKDKYITKDELSQIILCFREQSLKSYSEANIKEANMLIDEAIHLCIDSFISLVEFNIVEKNILIENLKINHQVLYEIIMKWREGFLSQEVVNVNNKQQQIFNKINDFF